MTQIIAQFLGSSALALDLPIKGNSYPVGSMMFRAWNEGWIASFQSEFMEYQKNGLKSI